MTNPLEGDEFVQCVVEFFGLARDYFTGPAETSETDPQPDPSLSHSIDATQKSATHPQAGISVWYLHSRTPRNKSESAGKVSAHKRIYRGCIGRLGRLCVAISDAMRSVRTPDQHPAVVETQSPETPAVASACQADYPLIASLLQKSQSGTAPTRGLGSRQSQSISWDQFDAEHERITWRWFELHRVKVYCVNCHGTIVSFQDRINHLHS